MNGDASSKNRKPVKRRDFLSWNKWGFKDTVFVYNKEDDCICITGDRYLTYQRLPFFREWVIERLGGDANIIEESIPEPSEAQIPKSKISEHILTAIKGLEMHTSLDAQERLFRSHGQTLAEMYALRTGDFFPRIPDVIVWPECNDDVVKVVELAKQLDLVIIPFGGGTCVSGALMCPQSETRTIISLDTSLMNRILWIDEENLTCCAEAGITGDDLDAQLRAKGYTTGHQPDSYELSTLGGWIATRASGMRKNTYGNIEDLVIHVKMVSPEGLVQKHCQVPRISAGPDIHHIILGSEGSLGVITEAVMKIRPLPTCQRYGSIVFPNFEVGVECLRDIARQRCQPSSIRLMDNEQFQFVQAIRAEEGIIGHLASWTKKFYITRIKWMDIKDIAVATLLFEGQEPEVLKQEQRVYELAAKYGGFSAGESNGKRGYNLTFVVAYIRDLALDYKIVSESFETSVPWSNVSKLCSNVKARVEDECKSRRLQHYFVTYRLTQTYDAGACIYFYFAFNYAGVTKDPITVHEEIEAIARDEILANGGSISHHHGIGKIRKRFLRQTESQVAIEALRKVKQTLDPNNIFANGNILCCD